MRPTGPALLAAHLTAQDRIDRTDNTARLRLSLTTQSVCVCVCVCVCAAHIWTRRWLHAHLYESNVSNVRRCLQTRFVTAHVSQREQETLPYVAQPALKQLRSDESSAWS